MRGCLTVLVGGVAFLAVLAWLALPRIAGVVVVAGLATSGLSGTDTRVEVDASPPYELLDLHADAIHVTSSSVSWRGMTAGSLDVRLTGVDLGGRTAAAVTGHLDGVSIPTSEGATSVDRIDLAGPSSAIRATLTLDAVTTARLAERAVERVVGQVATSVELVAPDRVLVAVQGRQAEGRLTVDAEGALVISVPPFGRTVVADPAADLPFVIDAVALETGGGATLSGTLDPRALGLSR
jgi:hypothetical protein